MRMLDRYMLRYFFHAYLICFVSVLGLYVVIDAFSNLDEFAEQKAGLAAMSLEMAKYYSYRLFLFFDQLSGIITMIAAMFTMSWLRTKGELTPLLAAGISTWRMILPILAAAVFITGLGVANQELLIPRIRLELMRSPDETVDENSESAKSTYDYELDLLLDATAAYPAQRRLDGVEIVLPPHLAGSLTTLRAKHAYLRPAEGDRPGGWELVDTDPRRLDRFAPEITKVLEELEPGRFFLHSKITLQQVTEKSHWRHFASTDELIRFARNPSAGRRVDDLVYLHGRFLSPVHDLLLLVLGFPFVLGRENRNVFSNIALCLALTGLFLGVTMACKSLGNTGLISPALSAWLPVMLVSGFLPALADLVQS